MSPHIHDDNLEAQLRRALMAEADMVNPAGDGLGRIRAGIDEQGRRVWWRNPMVALAAAAVIGLALGAGAMVLNDGGNDGTLVAEQPTASASRTPSAEPSPSETPSPTESATQEPAAPLVNLPIYYIGSKDNDEDPRLYREFQSLPVVGGNRIAPALTEMFRGEPVDYDYLSLWPKDTKVLNVDKTGDTALINLNQAATRANVGSGSAEVTMQQLVYTVTAADTSVQKVTLRVDGKVVQDLWGHIQVGTKAFTRAPMVDVQGLIWLLSPNEGDDFRRAHRNDKVRAVAIKGYGTAFEATVSWEVRNASGKVVEKGFTEGGANGEFAEFTDSVTLPPGTYEVRAFESSAEDGRPLHIDDKTFTVE